MIAGPLTRYKLLWGGKWRAVVNMFVGPKETFDAMRATSVVVYLDDDDEWLAVEIDAPGQIMERFEQSSDGRRWELLS